jgi:hypothetical protein
MLTAPSAILVICTSLRESVLVSLLKEAHFSACSLLVTPRCATRGSRGDLPYAGPRKPRSSPLDPYKTYLLERWHQGCRSGAQLERELRAKGYKGSQKAIYRCLASLELFVSSPSRRSSAEACSETESQPNPLLALSAPQATWLFFRKEEDLKVEEQEHLRPLRQASPTWKQPISWSKSFCTWCMSSAENGLRSGWAKWKAVISKPFSPL